MNIKYIFLMASITSCSLKIFLFGIIFNNFSMNNNCTYSQQKKFANNVQEDVLVKVKKRKDRSDNDRRERFEAMKEAILEYARLENYDLEELGLAWLAEEKKIQPCKPVQKKETEVQSECHSTISDQSSISSNATGFNIKQDVDIEYTHAQEYGFASLGLEGLVHSKQAQFNELKNNIIQKSKIAQKLKSLLEPYTGIYARTKMRYAFQEKKLQLKTTCSNTVKYFQEYKASFKNGIKFVLEEVKSKFTLKDLFSSNTDPQQPNNNTLSQNTKNISTENEIKADSASATVTNTMTHPQLKKSK